MARKKTNDSLWYDNNRFKLGKVVSKKSFLRKIKKGLPREVAIKKGKDKINYRKNIIKGRADKERCKICNEIIETFPRLNCKICRNCGKSFKL